MYTARRAALATVVLIFLLSQSKCNAQSSEATPTQNASLPQSLSNGTTTTSDDISPSGKPEEVQNKPADKHTKNGKPEAALYFEISKRMNECNLSLDDIRQVLSQGKDEDQFMYILADKLGYIVDGNYGDSHISVIKSRKDDLVTLLKEREMLLSPPLKTSDQDSSVSTEPPKVKAPVGKSNGQIGYEVSKKIQSLEADAIYELLNDFTFSGSLGYAVGYKLGYSGEEEYMKYLENANDEKLREQLQQVLKSKMPDVNEPASHIRANNQPEEGQSTTEVEPLLTEGSPFDKSYSDVPSRNSVPDPYSNSDLETEPPDEHASDDNINSNSELTSELALFKNEKFMAYLKSTNKDLYDALQSLEDQPADEDDPAIMDAMDEYQKWTESQTKKAKSDVANQEGNPTNLGNSGGEGSIQPVGGGGEKQPDGGEGEKQPDGGEGEKQPDGGEGEKQPDGGEGEKQPDGGEGEKQPDGGEGETQPVGGEGEKQPDGGGEKQVVGADGGEGANLDGKQSSVSDDEEEYVPSSSFGAWHFLSIFLILGAVVVIGYLCMHNRKKLREGVASYVNDSSKRRRRAREYKPLMST